MVALQLRRYSYRAMSQGGSAILAMSHGGTTAAGP